jgi:hypothetical protein
MFTCLRDLVVESTGEIIPVHAIESLVSRTQLTDRSETAICTKLLMECTAIRDDDNRVEDLLSIPTRSVSEGQPLIPTRSVSEGQPLIPTRRVSEGPLECPHAI